jgi:hypothetical protein
MRVYVSDVAVKGRFVEIPDKCPNCGQDLTSDNSLRVVRYDASSYDGKLARVPDDREEEGNDFIYNSAFEPITDELVDGLEYFCNGCDTSLVAGEMTRSKE